MPNIEAVLEDVHVSRSLAVIHFISGYRKLLIHADTQYSHAFRTLHGVMQPTRAFRVGFNSTASVRA